MSKPATPHPGSSPAVADDDKASLRLYGNIVQVTRTPWEINLHLLHAVVPRNLQAGETVNVLELADEIAIVTLPLDVGKKLVEVLAKMTGDDVLIEEGPKKEAGNV